MITFFFKRKISYPIDIFNNLLSVILYGIHVLIMLFAFICAYWCPTLFPCQTMFAYITIIRWVSLVEQELHTLPKIYMFQLACQWSSVCSISIFLCSVLFAISFLFFRQLSDLQFRSLITYVGFANFSSFNTLWLWTLFQPFNIMHLYFR